MTCSWVEGQITVEASQPNAVLDVLVNRHVLMRIGDPAGYSFQHQQFQEWYASHFVEHLDVGKLSADVASRDKLEGGHSQISRHGGRIYPLRVRAAGAWRPQNSRKPVVRPFWPRSRSIPLSRAEMIFPFDRRLSGRASASTIQGLGRSAGTTPGIVDRALRFMITSGRPEFLDQVWPLITHENDQVHLSALRAGSRFPAIPVSEAMRPSGLRRCRPTSEKTFCTRSHPIVEWMALISRPPLRRTIPTPKSKQRLSVLLRFAARTATSLTCCAARTRSLDWWFATAYSTK